MSIMKKFIAPSNLQFYISDVSIPESAFFGENVRIVSNGLSLTVPCQYEFEGDTEVIIGAYDEVPKDGVLAFDGSIPTPGGFLLVTDVGIEELMKYPVSNATTRLAIWTDGLEYPARVVVGVR